MEAWREYLIAVITLWLATAEGQRRFLASFNMATAAARPALMYGSRVSALAMALRLRSNAAELRMK
jgi:hypothetical protein